MAYVINGVGASKAYGYTYNYGYSYMVQKLKSYWTLIYQETPVH
jgi:hypothetical protein